MDQFVRECAAFLAALTEGLATLIIAIGLVSSLVVGIKSPPHGGGISRRALGIRIYLGRWLSAALEFLLAADILRTAVAPSWNDIGQLAAIAALRTALNYFLEREIKTEGKGEKR